MSSKSDNSFQNNFQVKSTPEGFRETGVVKWFRADKGYGFIAREGWDDIFVHFSEINSEGYRSLDEGDVVEFEAQDSPKGLVAKDVVKISSGEANYGN